MDECGGIMDAMAKLPPIDWEYSDWTGATFFVRYDPRVKEWFVGYECKKGYTTMGWGDDREAALKHAWRVYEENRKGERRE